MIYIGLSFASSVLFASNRSVIAIDSVLGDQIPALISIPKDVSIDYPSPACILLHGSGGLFKENEPGENCSSELENNYETLMGILEALGVTVIAPDSFGRDPRFCEDNSPEYMAFAPPPFFNAGDGEPDRTNAYKSRRIETRVLDAGGALKYLHELPWVDSKNICVIGTSNGGSTALVLASNGTGRHVAQYADINGHRPLESFSEFNERKAIFLNYPILPAGVEDIFLNLPVLKFSQAISPGCFVRKMIPTESPIDVSVLDYPDDFMHPEDARSDYDATYQYIDMGSLDNVPDHCREDGIRHSQATAYSQAFNVSPPRWLTTEYQGYGHNLVGENVEVIEKTEELVIKHFYRIFKNSFD